MPTCSAASYEWGSNVRQHEISCDGRILKVTANVALLLSKFRNPGSSQLLWIDAICINQNDLDERSQQVSTMGHIYKNVEVVLMWIGDEIPHTQDAISLIHRLAKECGVLKLKPGMGPSHYEMYEPSDLSARQNSRRNPRRALLACGDESTVVEVLFPTVVGHSRSSFILESCSGVWGSSN
jgi:hypothetical protein